jgi:transcription-repair coupling factor (superfamily II helicase)
MKNKWLLNLCSNSIKENDLSSHSFYSALSNTEEAVTIIDNFKKLKRNIVVVKQNIYTATKLYEELAMFLDDDELVLYVPEESLRVEAIASSYENMASRCEAMYNCLNDNIKVIITSSSAIIKYLPQPQFYKNHCIELNIDDEMTMNDLKEKLIISGYSQAARVDQPLTFSIRGGIVDIFSINYDNPIRIEFFDTIIESIRFFDTFSQRTVEKINKVNIIPATDIMFTDNQILEIEEKIHNQVKVENLELIGNLDMDIEYLKAHINMYNLYIYNAFIKDHYSIFNYIDNPVVLLSTKDKIDEHLHGLIDETVVYIQEMSQENKMLLKFNVFNDFDNLISKVKVYENNEFAKNIRNLLELNLPFGNTQYVMDLVVKDVDTHKIILLLKENEVKVIVDYLMLNGYEYNYVDDEFIFEQGINIVVAELNEGFELVNEKIIIYTSKEIFKHHVKKGRYINRYKESKILETYQELNSGDFVVHNQHGIGKYLGIVTKNFHNVHRDYLRIIYKGNDELLVPLEQFALVRKFVSKEGASPRLHKLGSNKWKETKAKLEENLEDVAGRLIELYSLRQEKIGFAYSKDTDLQKEFDGAFEYELTPDQKTAVEEIKKDMELDKPMDRLLCGDVGFGKTEVAARAGFKAVCDNKQVAFLCPTTILSIQHYKTFVKRLENFPVKVEVLNRFVLPSEVKRILYDVSMGKVDILIGTHRILSKDVIFKDLGLLVIDEEQRFGVEHKEKIKELKQSVDVLSLSATPIPRTLQMSLIGIRQLSTLDTPPNNRYPVQTYVVEKSRGLIVEAIQRELQRNGQVFYLYNNIEEVYSTARMIQREIKDANVAVAHGRMSREEIEDVMMQFVNNTYNVLVCTTIIETGIDIPNANTILIENAHGFGLSQLYQIKGRVGRSDRVAYAYLMIPEKLQVSEIAQKRLKAIKEFAQLGSGYKIAMRDLTIRGAGDLLGPTQSGFIDTVGIDMYMEMLSAAIKKRQGIIEPVKKESIKNNIKIDGYVPKEYAPEDNEKIDFYKKIEKVQSLEELSIMKESIVDQHGKMPSNVQYLFEKKHLDIIINDETVSSFKERNGVINIEFTEQFSDNVNGVKLFELFTNINRNIKIRYTNHKIVVNIPKTKNNLDTAIKLIETSKECINNEIR